MHGITLGTTFARVIIIKITDFHLGNIFQGDTVESHWTLRTGCRCDTHNGNEMLETFETFVARVSQRAISCHAGDTAAVPCRTVSIDVSQMPPNLPFAHEFKHQAFVHLVTPHHKYERLRQRDWPL